MFACCVLVPHLVPFPLFFPLLVLVLVGCWMLVVGSGLVVGCCLLFVVCWLLIVGCW